MKLLKKLARWVKSLYHKTKKRVKDMTFGLEVRDSSGKVTFDSDGEGIKRIIRTIRATNNADVPLPLPPPYTILVQVDSGFGQNVTLPSHSLSGSTLMIRYNQDSRLRKRPVTFLVLK